MSGAWVGGRLEWQVRRLGICSKLVRLPYLMAQGSKRKWKLLDLLRVSYKQNSLLQSKSQGHQAQEEEK